MAMRKKRIKLDLLPLIFVFMILPLAARGEKVGVTLGNYAWFPDGDFQYDFFMYFKSLLFLGASVVMLVILLDRLLVRRIKWKQKKSFVFLALYAVCVLLSTLCSVDKSLSLKGMWQQYETVWVLLAYLLTAFYGMQVVDCKEDLLLLLKFAAVGAALQGCLGLTQLLGNDFFAGDMGKALLSAGLDETTKEAMHYVYEGNTRSSVYMASYTPNYAAVYLVMILPLLAVLLVTAKRIWEKAVYGILCVILLLCLYGSGSRMGMFTWTVLLVLGIWTAGTRVGNWKPKKKRILLIAAAVGVLILILYLCSAKAGMANAWKQLTQKQTYDLQKIEPFENGILLDYKGKELRILPENGEFGEILQVQEEGQEMQTAVWDFERSCFYFSDTDYENLGFDAYAQDGTAYLKLFYQDIVWNFYKPEDAETYIYLNQYQKEDKIQTAKAVFQGYEQGFSGRIYIWGRTLPLLTKHLLFGSGPDTFAAEFPQSDYLMRANTSLGMYQQIPTKAHSFYLQTALQSGVLSLLCLLLFFGSWMMENVRKFSKKKGTEAFLQLGIFLAVCGFLIMGVLNDSNLAVSPIFWALIGISMGTETE